MTKDDKKELKDTIIEAVEPFFTALKGDLNKIDDRLDGINDKLGDI